MLCGERLFREADVSPAVWFRRAIMNQLAGLGALAGAVAVEYGDVVADACRDKLRRA